MTAPSILRQRNADAIKRAEAAANAMSGDNPEIQEKVEDLKGARGRDHIHTESARLVALADILEALADAKGVEVPEGEESGQQDPEQLSELDSLKTKHVQALHAHMINDVDTLRRQSDDDLCAIEGISKQTVEKIREEIGYPADED